MKLQQVGPVLAALPTCLVRRLQLVCRCSGCAIGVTSHETGSFHSGQASHEAIPLSTASPIGQVGGHNATSHVSCPRTAGYAPNGSASSQQ